MPICGLHSHSWTNSWRYTIQFDGKGVVIGKAMVADAVIIAEVKLGLKGINANLLREHVCVCVQRCRLAAVIGAPCAPPNENMFPTLKEGVETTCKQSSLRGSPSLPRLFFTVTTLLQDFKLKSLSINSLDLDKVVWWGAHGRLALLAVGLSHSLSLVTVTSRVIDAWLWVFIWLEDRYGPVLCSFPISAIPHF